MKILCKLFGHVLFWDRKSKNVKCSRCGYVELTNLS
jgi:hypothetical protein